jgi:outer membrane protein assembly factor BamB
MIRLFLVGIVLTVLPSIGFADWNQWRGPDRNGIDAKSPALAEKWTGKFPKKLWDSEPIPSDAAGGFSSVAVAGGRVYLYVNWKYDVPFETRKLDSRGLGKLGWHKTKPPAELLKKIEAARVSDERAKLAGGRLKKWIGEWHKANIPADQQKKLGRFVGDRLRRGKGALDFAALDKLATMVNKTFPTQAEFDKWFKDNGISDEVRAQVMKHVAVKLGEAHDTMVCLNAKDGKTVWKVNLPGRPSGWGSSGTPCVVDGRCYFIGSNSEVFCLKAEDGSQVWKKKVGGGERNSSLLVVDGLVVVQAPVLTALSATDGSVKWTQKAVAAGNNSPVVWAHGGKNYLVCNTGKKLSCVDPKDGKVLWSVAGGGSSTAAVAGGWAVIHGGNVVAYKITPAKAEKAWSHSFPDRGASPIIYKDHVYAVSNRGGLCVELKTGKVAWKGKTGTGEISSPILADGKIIAYGRGLVMFKADPAKCEVIGKLRIGVARCTSPSISGGKLFLRMKGGVSCYDVSKAGAEAAAKAEPAPKK